MYTEKLQGFIFGVFLSNFCCVEIQSKVYILQSMVTESSFTTGKFLSSSDHMDEENQAKPK